MANFPTTLDTLSNPTSTDLLENATAALDHDYQHATANDILEALEAKVGVNSSAVTTSHDYKLGAVTGTEKALTSGTSTQSVTGLTLVSPVLTLTSDATGDIYYRSAGGLLTRLPIGSTDQILAVQSGIPAWVANPSASNASATVAGIVELATTAETETGTDATRAVTPDGLHDMTTLAGAAWFLDEDTMSSDSATKTASQQSIKAYVDNTRSGTNGQTTRDLSTASGNQTIAHGLGRTPKMVRITVIQASTSGASDNYSFGSYNGTTNSSIYRGQNGNGQFYVGGDNTNCVNIMTAASNDTSPSTATATVDGTNITLAWTKAASATGTAYILWEVI